VGSSGDVADGWRLGRPAVDEGVGGGGDGVGERGGGYGGVGVRVSDLVDGGFVASLLDEW
jgi:hypothetical protein